MYGIWLHGGRERGKNKLPTLIFCLYFDNWQKFIKEGDVSKKSGGSPTSLNCKIQVKLSFWPKVLPFAYKSSSVRARWMMWRHCDMNLRAQSGCAKTISVNIVKRYGRLKVPHNSFYLRYQTYIYLIGLHNHRTRKHRNIANLEIIDIMHWP